MVSAEEWGIAVHKGRCLSLARYAFYFESGFGTRCSCPVFFCSFLKGKISNNQISRLFKCRRTGVRKPLSMHASKILQMFFHLNLSEYHNQSCVLQCSITRHLISMFIDNVFYLFCNVGSVFPVVFSWCLASFFPPQHCTRLYYWGVYFLCFLMWKRNSAKPADFSRQSKRGS